MAQALLDNVLDEIRRLKQEKQAVILAHNYQVPAIQDAADFVGDSLGLSQKAKESEAEIIVFCGVHFMAETAAIISPKKKVLIPDLEAGCSLAASMDLTSLRQWKAQHPGAVVVSYVNTTAHIKAESDYCCTSSNAVKVVESIPADKEILFLPDMFLGAYVQKTTGRKMHIWPGECHVHAGIRPKDIEEKLAAYPHAEFLIHPECGCVTQCMYFLSDGSLPRTSARILSTEGMIRHARRSDKERFLVATETGILYRLEKENPGKQFIPMREDAVCEYMKRITPEKLLRSLREEVYEVAVPEEVAHRARRAIERMLAIT